MRIEWTELALGRVDEIVLHIAAGNRDAAIRWTIGLFDAVDRLAAQFPEVAAPSSRRDMYRRQSMASMHSAPARRPPQAPPPGLSCQAMALARIVRVVTVIAVALVIGGRAHEEWRHRSL